MQVLANQHPAPQYFNENGHDQQDTNNQTIIREFEEIIKYPELVIRQLIAYNGVPEFSAIQKRINDFVPAVQKEINKLELEIDEGRE